MASASDIKLSIINQALNRTGSDALTSLNGDEFEVVVANINYDPIVAEELEESGAYFATKTGTPTLQTAQAAKPLPYQWQVPADLLTLRAVLYCGKELDGDCFSIEGRIVRTAFNTGITLRYIWNVAEDQWPSRFRRTIERRMRAVFYSATERFNEAEATDEGTQVQTKLARYAEAGQRRNRPIGGGSIVDARRRGTQRTRA